MSSKPIHSVPTKDLYARWAAVYDTDGNILQSIDDHLLPTLLDLAFTILPSHQPITITELGAGTGRNTIKLLHRRQGVEVEKINALDLSPEMLALAKTRCTTFKSPTQVEFYEFDALQPSKSPEVQALEGAADLVLSTLVLEHLPLSIFFSTIRTLLKPNGILVMSNMHADMGRLSRAGFMDGENGGGEVKVQGDSFVYEVSEVVGVGREEGFVVVGPLGVVERGVEEGDLDEGVVGSRGRKWVGRKVWFGCVMRLGG
jgi:SAM-dependent methyltransferase